ncbi:MAG TPA: DUF1549 and DUF1553 domain-containing protein [Gemmataceae bacterium]|nr:DUF1549 and DUF1553 domain-containing protein [Gemmataceae bacterium]
MRWLTFAFASLVVVAAASREACAGDAADLAAQIDRHIDTRLAAEGVRPAEPADDAEFLRRVYLDLHGVIPTTEETARFLADAEPKRRDKLIDALLAAPRYGEHLADAWQGYLVSPLADDYRVRSDKFRQWLAGRFNAAPWDRIATDILTATGKLEENPAVVYLIEGRLPRTVPDLTDIASRYFLGVRLSCAQCHDHPFVAWKQQDFWGMAAFFTQVQTPGKSKLVYQVGVKDYPEITLASLKDGGMIDGFLLRPPTFLGGNELQTGKGTTNRAALSEWMTSPKNPYFARAMANRTWWRLFGRGIVNPVDDMHSANAPSHPELLDLLARRFAESGFDLKSLTRAIVSSKAYQRTSRPGDSPEKQAGLFGRMSVKALSAGQLYDSLVTVFGPTAGKPGAATRFEFVQFFADDGDPDPTAYRRGIPHLLRQMNSGQFAGRNVAGLAARVAKQGRSADDVSGDLFLTILSRRPTATEQSVFRDHIVRSGSVESASRELAWALMMTSEFSLNR